MPVFFENGKFRYRITWWSRKHLVLSKVAGFELAATASQVEKLRAVLTALEGMPWPGPREKQVATAKVYIAFCLTVHQFQPVSETFMSQDAGVVALVFGTMPSD